MAHLEYINQLAEIALRLYKMANENIRQIEEKKPERSEVLVYYLGMLRRQAIMSYDLHVMLKGRPEENLTTPYILLRSLMDDFLHVLYLDLHSNPPEKINRINAKGYKENFESLKNLTNSKNQDYYGEKFDYLSQEQLEALEATFMGKAENKKYLNTNGDFKGFLQVRQVADAIDGSEHCNVARDRAYYYWKSFSSFVHYSNWCYEYELVSDIIKLQHMEECFQYVFNTIFLSFKHFNRTLSAPFACDRFLQEEMKFVLINTAKEKNKL